MSRVGRASRRLAPAPALCLAAALSGCGAGGEDEDGDGVVDGPWPPNNVTVVAPTAPTGAVVGAVLEAAGAAPLSGARVRLFGGAGALEQRTDAEGRFRFVGVPAEAGFSAVVEADGHAPASLAGLRVEAVAGNFPTRNGALDLGPVSLLPSTGRFEATVVGDDGRPVPGALVTVETAVAWLERGAPRGSESATAATGTDGLVAVTGLPDVWRLPPRLEASAALVVHVAPVDLDADGRPDLDGAVLALDGRQVRTRAQAPVVVLRRAGATPLTVLASNVAGLAGDAADGPSLLDPGEPVRLVLASPVDVAGVTVDLRGEDGSEPVEASVSVSAGGVALAVQPAAPLAPGAEYNVALRIPGADPRAVEVLERAATFFVREDASVPLAAQARFVDAEGDGTWGNGSDQLRVSLSRALGRRGRVPAFRAETWLGLDLDGSGRVGDGAGELPPPGEGYPPPIVLEAREPSPGNGAALSGFTRRVAPLGLGLVTPLAAGAGPVTFELRLPAARNDGEMVGSPAGRAAPERLTGTMALVGP